MTTKLLNFKTFLSKATYQPIGIKPCNKPGQHRHWGRMDCHDIPQKHKKHTKMGIDPHHGMDPTTGQIPHGTMPPNAHDSYDDGHHSAKAHGEHTGGGTAGNCKPGTYKGKTAPFHRHPGADYCHAVDQKHGKSSPNKAVAQNWHDTHQAQLQESWYLFNESQGIEQEEATADPLYEGGTQPEETAEDVTFDDIFVDDYAPSGSVDNPHNAAVNDIITLKEDYIVDHPSKTYQILEIYEEGDLLGAKTVHTETGFESVIALSNDNIESVEKWQPEGDAVDSWNPHQLAIGSVIATGTVIYNIEGVDPDTNQVFYTVTDEKGENPQYMNYNLSNFNDYITDAGYTVQTPSVPDGFKFLAVGDTIGSWNIKNLQEGATVHSVLSTGEMQDQGKILSIEEKDGKTLYTIEWSAAVKDADGNIKTSEGSWQDIWDQEMIVDSNWELAEYAPSGSPDTYDKFYTEDAVKDIPKVGTEIDSDNGYSMLAGTPPGTTLVLDNGSIIHIKNNKIDPDSDIGGMIDYTLNDGSFVEQVSWKQLLQNGAPMSVQSLPDVASYVKNKGFQLGGKVNPDNFISLPIGLSFAYKGLGEEVGTATVTNISIPTDEGAKPGIYVDLTEPNGAEYKNVFINELTQLSSKDAEAGFKIVGLPDGTVVQDVPEPTGVTPINKHGLEKGTTLKVMTFTGAGYKESSGTIVKTHKTKSGQNYSIELDDGTTTKISSSSIKDAGDEEAGGVSIQEAVYKPGQEPTDGEELTLPPLGSESGNWDEVLEETGGKLGYNDGGQFTHKQTGDQFYIKFSSSGSDQQVKSEDLANKLYELVGVPTLGTSLVSFQGKTALKSSWDSNLQKIDINNMANESAIMDNFVIDAWLANWDVIGPQHDNTQKSGGKIIKVDSGGALGFHGAGSPKAFPNQVSELESMRDPYTAKVAHKVFGQIEEQNLIKGAQKLSQVTDAHIDAIVNASQVTNKSKMAATLKARRDDIIQKVLSKDMKQGSEWTESIGKPGQHKHAGYQGWHSKTLDHPPSNTAANNAHKDLGLNYAEPSLGPTSSPEKKLWNMIANSNNSAKVKELAKKALATDFKTGDGTYATSSAIENFLADNNIKDTFEKHFSAWQGGGDHFARIKINAAVAKLKGVDQDIKAGEGTYWTHVRNSTVFADAWDEGVNEAMAMLPYVAASQQALKSKTTKANPDALSSVHRGLQGNVANQIKQAVTYAKAQAKIKRVYIGGGMQGFSLNSSTSKSFAGGSGVVLSKKKLPIDDVLLYFPAFSNAHGGEQELAVDPSAIQEFSLDEIKFKE